MRSKNRWGRFLLVYSLVFLLLGAGLCALLYAYAGAYERSLPERCLEALLAETEEARWEDLACVNAPFAASPFEDGELLLRSCYREAVRGRELSWRKAPEYRPEAPCYQIWGGGSALCLVALEPRPGESAGFGRPLWQVKEIRSLFDPQGLRAVAVEIDAPDQGPLFLNGRPLGAEQRVAPPEDTADDAWVRYRVEGLRGEVRVTEADGSLLSPIAVTEALLSYRVPPRETYEVRVRAPRGVRVTVNGRVLPPEEAAASPGVLAGLEAYTGAAAFDTLEYRREGLVRPPEVTAEGPKGEPLSPLVTPSGQFVFFLPSEEALADWAQPVVNDFFQRYMTYAGSAWSAGRQQALLRGILPETELYAYVRDSRAAMIWASATTVEWEELRCGDFVPVGEDCFVATVRYKGDFSARAWHESYSYEMANAYELAFVRQGDRWLAAAMSVLP